MVKNPKSGRNLQLDGYSEKLKIGFEHQGVQHYDVNHFRHDKNIKQRDLIKKTIFNELIRLKIKIPKLFYTEKLELIFQHRNKIHSKKEILTIAKEYKTQKDFIKKEYSLYKKLIRNQTWDEISRKTRTGHLQFYKKKLLHIIKEANSKIAINRHTKLPEKWEYLMRYVNT